MKTITTAQTLSTIVKAELPTLIKTMNTIKATTPATGIRKIKANRALKVWLAQFQHYVLEATSPEVVKEVAKEAATLPEFKVFEDMNFHPSFDWGFAQFDKFFEMIGA